MRGNIQRRGARGARCYEGLARDPSALVCAVADWYSAVPADLATVDAAAVPKPVSYRHRNAGAPVCGNGMHVISTILGTFFGICLFVAVVWLVIQIEGWRNQ